MADPQGSEFGRIDLGRFLDPISGNFLNLHQFPMFFLLFCFFLICRGIQPCNCFDCSFESDSALQKMSLYASFPEVDRNAKAMLEDRDLG